MATGRGRRGGMLPVSLRAAFLVLFALGVTALPSAAITHSGPPATGLPALHDDLAFAVPGQGDTLSAVPDTLRLVFTRAQNLDLASVALEGPAGGLTLGELRAHPDSAAVVLVPVRGPWSTGEHTVRWRIVGQDGHPVTGTYAFVVEEGARGLAPDTPDTLDAAGGPDTAEGAGPTTAAEAGSVPDDAADEAGAFDVHSPAYVAIRWLGFASLLGLLGSVSWALLVLPLADAREREQVGGVDVAGGRRTAATVGLWSAAVLLVAGGARLWAQARALGGGLGDPVVGAVLASTAWGAGWWLQAVAGLAALLGFAWARRRPGTLPWALAAVSALALSFTPALSGHAVSMGGPVSLAVVADAGHVLAAGGWMGGLLLLLVTLGRRHDRAPATVAPLVAAFSVTALGFATLLALTGVFAAWQHLGAVDALWTTEYGRTLLVKLGLLLPLLATGAYNWLRVRPALAAGEDATSRLRRTGGAELGLAVLVLIATAVLVATPPPTDSPSPSSSPSSSTLLEEAP